MRQLRDGVGHNIRSVPALIPILPRHELLDMPEHDRLGYGVLVVRLVEPVRRGRELPSDSHREIREILLGTLAYYIGVSVPHVYKLGQIGL